MWDHIKRARCYFCVLDMVTIERDENMMHFTHGDYATHFESLL